MKQARNYTEVVEALAARREFKHSTMSAFWDERRGDPEGAEYVVLSYQTAVATYSPATKVLWTTNTRYSVTSSKHMSKIAQGFRDLLSDPEVQKFGRYGHVQKES